MTWVKLADTFTDHPKVVAAGDRAAWLYVAGLCYCSRHLTDGEIPKDALGRLCGLPQPTKLAARLVDVGLWSVTETGWAVNDYTEHQRSRNEVETLRAGTRERVAKHRSNAVTNTDVTGPDTDKSRDTDNHSVSSAEPFDSDFETWWAEYPRKIAKADARKAYRARRRSGVDASRLLEAVGNYARAKEGIEVRYVKHGASFLAKDGPWSEWEHGEPEPAQATNGSSNGWKPNETRRCINCANTGNYFKDGEMTACKVHAYA